MQAFLYNSMCAVVCYIFYQGTTTVCEQPAVTCIRPDKNLYKDKIFS